MRIEPLAANLEYIPQVIELYQKGIDGLLRYYGPDFHDSMLAKRDEGFFRRKADAVYLALDKGLDGVIETRDFDDFGAQNCLIEWVFAADKGKGVGSALLREVIQDSYGKKDIVSIAVHKDNRKVHKLYRRLGFIEVSRVGNFRYMGRGITPKGKKRIVSATWNKIGDRIAKKIGIDFDYNLWDFSL